jgi:hypothetical protein
VDFSEKSPWVPQGIQRCFCDTGTQFIVGSDLVNNAANGELLVMVETIKNARWLTKIVLADLGSRSEQVFVELKEKGGAYGAASSQLKFILLTVKAFFLGL